MEHEPQPDKDFSVEKQNKIEADTCLTVVVLPEMLGFLETTELSNLRLRFVEALAVQNIDAKELSIQYHHISQELIAQNKGENYNLAQVGLNIQTALMYRDGGREDLYIDSLQDAITHAHNEYLDDVVTVLEVALAEAQNV